jgi:hypothetical protein
MGRLEYNKTLAVAASSALWSDTVPPMRHTLLLVVLLPLGCIVEAPGGDKQAAAAPATAAPRPGTRPAGVRNGANFDGKVELLAASFNPPVLTPGDVSEVKLYFRVLQPLPEDWQIFVHAEDPEGKGPRTNFDHQPKRPTSTWKPGETVEDSFAVGIPAGSAQRSVELWVGFWLPRTDARLPVKNPEAVRTDNADRVLLARLLVQP